MTVASFVLSIIALLVAIVSPWYAIRKTRPIVRVGFSSEADPLQYVIKNIGERRIENVSIRWNFDPAGTHIPLETWEWDSLDPGQAVSIWIPDGSPKGTNDFHMMLENNVQGSRNPEQIRAGLVTFDDPTIFRRQVRQQVRLPVPTDTSSRGAN